MARTVAEFHEIAAALLVEMKTEHDEMRTPDNVTTWRHAAHVLSMYANKEKGADRTATWGAFWSDGIDRIGFVRLLARRTRFARCQADGDAPLCDDSVEEWERLLAHAITAAESAHAFAVKIHKADAARRLGLELDMSLNIAAAYTGCSDDDLRAALRECDGEHPTYTHTPEGRVNNPHPLFELITANRPTL